MKKKRDEFGFLCVAGLRVEKFSDGRTVASKRELKEETHHRIDEGDRQAVADLGRGAPSPN